MEDKNLTLKERLANLLAIKSLVTLVTTMVFAYLASAGKLEPDKFLLIFTTIISFYFGTQSKKPQN